MNIAGLAHRLGARRQSRGWRCDCPLCGYDLSLDVGDTQPLVVACRGGCDYSEIMSLLSESGVLFDDLEIDDFDLLVGDRQSEHHHDEAYHAERTALARQLYDVATCDERIRIYLRSRHIAFVPPVLRFNSATPHRLGIKLPALLAPIVNVEGEQVALHKTFLKSNGTGKADIGKKFQRETCGPKKGGVIRLGEYVPERPLIIAEGLENALAASQLLGFPAWAGIDADNIRSSLILPALVTHVVLAADNDGQKHAGQRAALAAYDRWTSEGRTVEIFMPDQAGDDFNDLLMRGA